MKIQTLIPGLKYRDLAQDSISNQNTNFCGEKINTFVQKLDTSKILGLKNQLRSTVVIEQ